MNPDYLIIGAGAIGLAMAQALLQQGARVTVLERGEAGQEFSWAGGGILSPLCLWDYPDEVIAEAIILPTRIRFNRYIQPVVSG